MDVPGLPSNRQLRDDAAVSLIRAEKSDYAIVLLACTLSMREVGCLEVPIYDDDEYDTFDVPRLHASLICPPSAHELLANVNGPIFRAIFHALADCVPHTYYLDTLDASLGPAEMERAVRLEPQAAMGNMVVQNQCLTDALAVHITWNKLRFRSESERRIAAALDQSGVLYLPNCMARLGSPSARRNREPDFLVCHDGKCGVLEVDGEPFHPPSRTVEDHERDRLFKQHGIRVVEHFDASRCYEAPQAVVKDFLNILRQS